MLNHIVSTGRPINNLTGKVFGRLVVIEYTEKRRRKSVVWKCKCACGNTIETTSMSLTGGNSTSCGCLRLERSIASNKQRTKHGMASDRIYFVYYSMLNRCYNKNGSDYNLWGDRGIIVCDRWLGKDGFKNFYEDMGVEYVKRRVAGEKISLDRIDVDGNYEPSNCRWATDSQQAQNTRICTKSINFKLHKKRQINTLYLLSCVVHNKIKNSKLFERLIGCTTQYFKKYFESLFEKGMTWQNYGTKSEQFYKRVWEVGHITPTHSFDLADAESWKKCFHYTNLCPEWKDQNRRKEGLLK